MNRDLDSEREVLEESKEVLESKEEVQNNTPIMITMASGKQMDLNEIISKNPPFFETQEPVKHPQVKSDYNEYPVNRNGEIVGYMYGKAR